MTTRIPALCPAAAVHTLHDLRRFVSPFLTATLVLSGALLSACGGKEGGGASVPEPVGDGKTAVPETEPLAPASAEPAAPAAAPSAPAETASPASVASAPPVTAAPATRAETTTPAGPDALGARVQTAKAPGADLALKERRKLLPIDAAKRDKDAVAVRERLLQAIERRDKNGVLDAVADDVKVGFGGGGGKEALVKEYGLDDPKSPAWQQLRDIVKQGWAFDPQAGEGQGMYYAPYLFKTFPAELDAAEYGAVTGEKVNIRAEPKSGSNVVDTVSYEIVRVEHQPSAPTETIAGETYPWVKVTLPDGKTGYVFGRYVRTPMDLRAGFKKVNGAWKIAFLVAGD